MHIQKLLILPPLAIARFGSSGTPLEAFDLKVREDAPLDFQTIVPKETLEVDRQKGVVTRQYVPDQGHLRFRDEEGIRPVCPFLEVFAETSEGNWEPLDLPLLSKAGLTPSAVSWS